MSPHVARCRCQQWRQDRLPQTFTPYDPSCWSQLSSQVHSQRISGFLASYSADSNAWSNNFNTIFWSDEPTSDASGSWLSVILNRQHNTKQTRRSENDNTPQPLDQWTNSSFIGQQVGNCKSFTLTHYFADLSAMHRGRRSIPLCIQHHIQLTSLSFQVSQTSHCWVTAISIFYLENPRSRSWVRSKFEVTMWV